jgi:alpha-tubulin suppressor-like RCC1 family protein
LSDVHQIGAGAGVFCATTGPYRTVTCWGNNAYGQVGPPVGGVVTTPFETTAGPADQVRTGSNTTCALVRGGDVLCWGHNGFGEFGNGNTQPSAVTSTRALLADAATSFAFRWTTGCALLKAGGVQCWGENYYGVLGDGSVGVNAIRPQFVDWSQTK